MRRINHIIITLATLLLSLPLSAQVSWLTPEVTHLSGDRYLLSLTAQIEQGWKMYDMTTYEDGPNPTSLNFVIPPSATLIGEIETLAPATIKWDEMFEQEIGYYQDSVTFTQQIEAPRGGNIEITAEWMLCSATSCMPPTDHTVTATISPSTSPSLLLTIIEAILWGLAALLTPCVFPMVPMTISYFIKGNSGGRRAASLYGAFIVALYTLPIAAIILTTYLFGGDAVTANIFNWIATHWLPNILFFVIFMLFAASLLGAFEITLPSNWVNRSDSQADKGSIKGIFFLALTLVLVSFSCTGPIVGSVLIKSTSGEFWQPIVTMLAFSSAFALPFVIVALFPSLLQQMPRSGGWLADVKVVLGFLEIALGLKFLSVADQTYHWNILSRELYVIIWIAVFSLLALYLLGKLRIGGHTPKRGPIHISLACLSLAFVVYVATGLWGAPLKPLAGYLPPPSTHSAIDSSDARFSAIEEAQAYANSVGKPLLVDFTGYGCVNCREMEQRVWSDPTVDSLLRNEYVIVALYMDDKRELPQQEWITTPSGRVLKTIGRVNSHLALSRFGVNAQPYYILLGRDGEELAPPRGYNLDINAYINFLEEGLDNYNSDNK